MNGITSPATKTTHSVPQGSILGPLLFNLYINDLPGITKFKMLLYADDSVIYASADSFHDAWQAVQTDLENVNLWCRYHKLSMNCSKTKAMYFSPRPPDNIKNIRIELSGCEIDYVNVYKYLGIHLDTKLSFHNQFNDTYKLASYKLLMLRRIRPVTTEFTALTVVKSMLLPYLDMGNLYLTSQTQKDLGKLDIILNTALPVVYGVKVAREVHTLDLYTKANLFPLSYRREYFLLNLVYRLIATDSIKCPTA